MYIFGSRTIFRNAILVADDVNTYKWRLRCGKKNMERKVTHKGCYGKMNKMLFAL